jgi:cell division ATPase FtsA
VALIAKARDEAINAEDMEQLVKQHAEAAKGPKRRGAPVSRRRFKTSKATVIITFRKGEVSTEDVLAALDEAKQEACGPGARRHPPCPR